MGLTLHHAAPTLRHTGCCCPLAQPPAHRFAELKLLPTQACNYPTPVHLPLSLHPAAAPLSPSPTPRPALGW